MVFKWGMHKVKKMPKQGAINMVKRCEFCNEKVEAFREHTNTCEKCTVEAMRDFKPEYERSQING